MELAFREEPTKESELCNEVRRNIFLFAAVASLVALAIHLIGPVIPFLAALIISLVVSVIGTIAALVFSQERTLRAILLALFLPPLLTIGAAIISTRFLSNRALASFTLAALSLGLMYLTIARRHPIHFYREWIFTAANLTPKTRQNRKKIIAGSESSGWKRTAVRLGRIALSLTAFGVVVFLVAVVPAYSPTLAIVVLFVIAIFLNDFRPRDTFRLALKVLSHFLTYGRDASGAAGVWIPETTIKQRRRAIVLAMSLFYLSLSTGLCLYFPADLFAIESQVKREVPQQPSQKEAPSSSTAPQVGSQLAERSPQAIRAAAVDYYGRRLTWSMVKDRNADTHAGVNAILSSIWKTFSLNLRIILLYFVLPALSALVLPNLLVLGLFRHRLLKAEKLRAEMEARDKAGRTQWEWYIDRIRDSQHEAEDPSGRTLRERDHVFLGVEPQLQAPVLIDRRIFSEHCYIVGQSGSGKTSLGIMPLLMQLDRPEDPQPVVIIDLKGDPALFHLAKEQARRCGQMFKFFSPEQGKDSFYFNPFKGFESEHRSPIQLCNLFLDSLSLNHGEGYGRSYYSRQSRLLLFDAINHSSKPRTFPDLLDLIIRLSKNRRYGDCFELLSTIHALEKYKFLSDPSQSVDPERVIHLPEVIEKNQVCYFWLPAAVESISVREIGKLALFCLLSAAIDRQRAGEEPRQVYLFIDEFQRIAGENFRIILEQARSFGIGATLANQTLSDLWTRDFDLRPTVRTNTRLQLYFSVNDTREIKMLSEMSGHEISVMRSVTSGENRPKWFLRQRTSATTWNETIKSRLDTNEIARISDHPQEFIAYVSRGSGYTQFGGLPFPVRTDWPIHEETYRKWSNTPLPNAPLREDGERANIAPRMADKEAREDLRGVAEQIEEKLAREWRAIEERLGY